MENNIIEFKNMNYKYAFNKGFNEFNLQIKKGELVSLIGPSGAGKSTLLKMLCHKIDNSGLFYNGQDIKEVDVDVLRKEIVVVSDEELKKESLYDELSQYLKYLNFSNEEIENRINELIDIFDLNDFLEKDINYMSKQNRYLLKILRYLIIKPKFIAIDCMLSDITKTNRQKIINYVKRNDITLLNVTNDLNDTLLCNRTLVMEDFVIILEGNTNTILKTDTLLKRLGFELPVAADLSIELGHYEVINKFYIENRELVNALWK